MIVGYTVTLSKVGNSYRIVLPKPACVGLQWNQGDKLNLSVEEGKITITKAPFIVSSKGSAIVAGHLERITIDSKTSAKGKTASPANENAGVKPLYVPKESRSDRFRRK